MHSLVPPRLLLLGGRRHGRARACTPVPPPHVKRPSASATNAGGGTPLPPLQTMPLAGNSSYYNQTYWGFPGARNYTSPQIHAVVVEGLVPGQTYFFRVGDPLLQAWSEVQRVLEWKQGEWGCARARGRSCMLSRLGLCQGARPRPMHLFSAFPWAPILLRLLPRLQELNITMPADSSVYPMRLGIVGDLGQTYNSSSTIDNLIAAQADVSVQRVGVSKTRPSIPMHCWNAVTSQHPGDCRLDTTLPQSQKQGLLGWVGHGPGSHPL